MTLRDHSSDDLYSGVVVDFWQAMDLLDAACESELAQLPYGDEEVDTYLFNQFHMYKAATQAARDIYRRSPLVADAVTEMRTSDSEGLLMIADALEQNNYQGLAF